MTKILKYCSHAAALLLLAGLLTACGDNGSTTTVTSSTTPTTFYSHSIAFRNHTTLTWGYNGFGQLGNESSNNSAEPAKVLAGAIGGAVGGTHTVAFKNISGANGVWAWGNNGFGQLGNATTTASTKPVRVVFAPPQPNVTAVAAGGNHTLALDANGNAWAWGSNGFGQLGVDSTKAPAGYAATPVQVFNQLAGAPLAQVTRIAAGGSHSLALVNDDLVFAWGYNASGQLGDGTLDNRNNPTQIAGFSAKVAATTGTPAIAAGGSHNVLLKSDGTVWTWGYNGLGQLGTAITATPISKVPLQVAGITGTVTAIAAGLDHTLALLADGTVLAWGFNGRGQLGNNSITDSSTPVKVQVLGTDGKTAVDLTGIVRIFAAGHHNYAVRSDGTVWAWGDNASSQLGLATASTPLGFSNVAVQVPGLTLAP